MNAKFASEVITIEGEKLPGKWIYGGLFPQNGIGDRAIIYQETPKFGKYPVHADTVGQFVGIRDANNKDLYEGDIIYFITEHQEKLYHLKGIIVWEQRICGFSVKCPWKYDLGQLPFVYRIDDKAFIPLNDVSCIICSGNIHDGEFFLRNGTKAALTYIGHELISVMADYWPSEYPFFEDFEYADDIVKQLYDAERRCAIKDALGRLCAVGSIDVFSATTVTARANCLLVAIDELL